MQFYEIHLGSGPTGPNSTWDQVQNTLQTRSHMSQILFQSTWDQVSQDTTPLGTRSHLCWDQVLGPTGPKSIWDMVPYVSNPLATWSHRFPWDQVPQVSRSRSHLRVLRVREQFPQVSNPLGTRPHRSLIILVPCLAGPKPIWGQVPNPFGTSPESRSYRSRIKVPPLLEHPNPLGTRSQNPGSKIHLDLVPQVPNPLGTMSHRSQIHGPTKIHFGPGQTARSNRNPHGTKSHRSHIHFGSDLTSP
jgi:hypothetical protein